MIYFQRLQMICLQRLCKKHCYQFAIKDNYLRRANIKMSFLDNNPFNRPSPNFTANINTTNFYSGYDYTVTDKNTSNISYGSNAIGGYFGSNTKSQSNQYKYSRAVEDSPFLSGSNPFATSKVNASASYQKQNCSSLGTNNNNYGSNASYSNYGFEDKIYDPKIYTANGRQDRLQDQYFKTDKYDDKFRKSNFQAQFDIQLGKARQNDADVKYKIGAKEKDISKFLQNNPFQKGSLKSISNRYSSSTVGGLNQFRGSEAYQNKYEDLQYKPSYLVTSNVNAVPGFGISEANSFLSNQKYDKYSEKYAEKYSEKYQKTSDKDSGNTFINKFDDIISSSDQNSQNKVKPKTKNQSHQNHLLDRDNKQLSNTQSGKVKSKLDNPFVRNSNPFNKNALTSQRKSSPEKQANMLIEYDSGGPSLNTFQKQSYNNPTFQIDHENKYDQYIYKKNSNFPQQRGPQMGSKRKYDKRVEQQFQLWVKQSSKGSKYSNLNYFENQKPDPIFKFDNYLNSEKQPSIKENSIKETQENTQKQLSIEERHSMKQRKAGKQRKTAKNQIICKDSMDSFGMKQSLYQRQESPQKAESKQTHAVNHRFPSFMKQSSQRDKADKAETLFSDVQNKQSMSEHQLGYQRNVKQFRFSGQDFTQSEQQQGNSVKSIYADRYLHKNKVQLTKFQNQTLGPAFSKQTSHASLTQNNTEQKLDEKLQKFRYNYDAKTEQKINESFKFNDFIDINMDEQDLNRSYCEQQSFQMSPKSVEVGPTSLQISPIYVHTGHTSSHFRSQSPQVSPSFVKVSPTHDSNQGPVQERNKRPNLRSRTRNQSSRDHSLEQSIEQIKMTEKLPVVITAKVPFLVERERPNGKNCKLLTDDEKYEFKALEEFEKQYRYQMKGSGFDFGQDQFQETQKNLDFEQDAYEDQDFTRTHGNKVLLPEYGYQGQQKNNGYQKYQKTKNEPNYTKTKQKMPLLIPNQQLPSNHLNLIEGQEPDDEQEFIPSFKVGSPSSKNKNIQSNPNFYKKQNNLKSVNTSTTSSLTNERKKQNIQQKVQRMKIYESQNQTQPFRSSGQYEAVQCSTKAISKSVIKGAQKVWQSSSSQSQNYYKSPLNKNSQQQASKRSSNRNTQTLQDLSREMMSNQTNTRLSKWHSENKIIAEESEEKLTTQNEEQFIDEFYEEDLKQTKKHSLLSRNPQLTYLSQYMQQPVRDSFQFEVQRPKRSQKQIKVKKSNTSKLSPKIKPYPTLLQLKGNIYHLIQFV